MSTEPSGAQSFRTGYQPGFRATAAPVGTARFFAEVEARRYSLEPHIAELVEFERWAGSDVLEACCGIGTDGFRLYPTGSRLERLQPVRQFGRRYGWHLWIRATKA